MTLFLTINDTRDDVVLDICTTYKKAQDLIEKYKENFKDLEMEQNFRIDSIFIDPKKEVLWQY